MISSGSVERMMLPKSLRGRSIHDKIIPTVCNLKNMLDKMVQINGDYRQLKQWEKRSYKAYHIDDIKLDLLKAPESQRKEIIPNHILTLDPTELGASCVDIYLVAYVAETYEPGRAAFYQYVIDSGISDEEGSAQAIWQVGKGDGVYLDILNSDGSVKDWNFITKWVKG